MWIESSTSGLRNCWINHHQQQQLLLLLTPWIFLSFLVDDANAKKQAMKVGGFPNLGQIYITYIHTFDDDWIVSAALALLQQLL
jgi:hypothetical protein